VLPGSKGRVAPRVAPGHVYSVGPTPGVPGAVLVDPKCENGTAAFCEHEGQVHAGSTHLGR